MPIDLETRAAELIRAAGQLAVPLTALHRELADEYGEALGSVRLLRERLARRRDLFRVIEAGAPPWDTRTWSEADRERYATALREAGLVAQTLVATLDPRAGPSADEPLAGQLTRRLDAALIQLADPGHDPGPNLFTEMLLEIEELRTQLRDLLPS